MAEPAAAGIGRASLGNVLFVLPYMLLLAVLLFVPLCLGVWLAFQDYFTAEWFLVKEAVDVHTNWMTFKQTAKESFMQFGNRICASTTHFTDHLPAINPDPEGAITECVEAYRSLATGDEDDFDALPADQRHHWHLG